MRTRIAHLISNSFSPLVLGIAMIALVAFNGAASTIEGFKWFLLVTCLAILPVLLISLYMVKTGRMDSLFSNRRHQRHHVYVVGLFFDVLAIWILNLLNAPTILIAGLVAGLASVVCLAFINLWWKISVHSSTVAAFVALLFVLFGWWTSVSLVLLPVIWWARLNLAQHTLSQVMAGSALSVVILLVTFSQHGVI
ncbi:MAG: phosphatidic acid phosphatase [Dehalogenimonas sp.]